jgi:hypothetical protein
MTEQLLVLIPSMPGVSVETVWQLEAERLVVMRGCDPNAYAALAERFACTGMIATANGLLDRARHYGDVIPCQS